MTPALPVRATPNLLRLLAVFVDASTPLWGLDVTKLAQMPYGTGRNDIDRLLRRGWLCRVEESRKGSPPRHLYILTPDGRTQAIELLKAAGQ